VILADEVGLGKTIEAGLIITQYWSEAKRKIILQYDEPDGAKFLTEFFSENEILKQKETKSEAWSFTQDRTSFSEDEKLKKVILPVELSTLKPLEAFVKIGNYPVSKVSVEYQSPIDTCEVLIRGSVGFFDSEEKNKIEDIDI
jgi:hypothetical protein